MSTNHTTLKIQVPALPPVPPRAAQIGEFAADLLALAYAAAASIMRALTSIEPGNVRAELRESADELQIERPAATLSLRSVAAKGWIY
jgi:hypothetical protein